MHFLFWGFFKGRESSGYQRNKIDAAGGKTVALGVKVDVVIDFPLFFDAFHQLGVCTYHIYKGVVCGSWEVIIIQIEIPN